MRIAIIGTGISGSLAARLLASRYEVTVFEANDYAGGHTNTVDVTLGDARFPVDTGFMVFNRRTYPNFCRMLEILGVASEPTDMSFSVRCSNSGVEYQGSSLNGLFTQRLNLLKPSFWKLIRDIFRFNRRGTLAADDSAQVESLTVGDFVEQCGLGRRFVDQYLVPMAAAIWSTRPQDVLQFPAHFLVRFFANHGLMQLRDRPQWRIIKGGAKRYLDRLLSPLQSQVFLNQPVRSIRRLGSKVSVTTASGVADRFDHVVIAAHADQALAMLDQPTADESRLLSAFPYQKNQAVLHTDERLLPSKQRAWASWNYHIPAGQHQSASVTYDLSRLQHHASPDPILLTLNPTEPIRSEKRLKQFTYHHPAYAHDSLAAQEQFESVSGRDRIHFCGAYWGYGFHEDGVRSALAVASHFDIGLEACAVASTKAPSATFAGVR